MSSNKNKKCNFSIQIKEINKHLGVIQELRGNILKYFKHNSFLILKAL